MVSLTVDTLVMGELQRPHERRNHVLSTKVNSDVDKKYSNIFKRYGKTEQIRNFFINSVVIQEFFSVYLLSFSLLSFCDFFYTT